ncbi:MAG: Yip1 family protein [Stenomitos frigidus ULC029]
MSHPPSQQNFWSTLWHAIALQTDLYEHARNTPKTHRLALTIVLLAAISHMLGSAVILLINRASGLFLLLALLLDGLSVVAGYYVWTFIILKIGQWLKPIDPTYGDLLSPVGFAYAPQVLNVLTLIPLLGRPIELILALWSLLAVIVATREGLDLSTRRATFICLLSWTPIQLAIGSLQVLQQGIIKAF